MSLLVDDRQLLKRFRDGDGQALEQVFNHYAAYVAGLLRKGFSFSAGGNTARFAGYVGIFDLEDALQEVFRRAFSEAARSNYDGLRPYRAYLTAITKNTVINDYLARRRALERFSVDDSETYPDDAGWSAADDPLAPGDGPASGHPERDAQTRELRGLIAQFKESLEPRECTVFELRFEEGLSHTEITARIGLSPSKIKTTEGRIRTGLMRFMRRRGYLESLVRRRPRSLSPKPQGEES